MKTMESSSMGTGDELSQDFESEQETLPDKWSVLNGNHLVRLTDLDESRLWDIEKKNLPLLPNQRVRTRAVEVVGFALERTQPALAKDPEKLAEAYKDIVKAARRISEYSEIYGDTVMTLEMLRFHAPELSEVLPPMLHAIHEIYGGRTFQSIAADEETAGIGDSRRISEGTLHLLYLWQQHRDTELPPLFHVR